MTTAVIASAAPPSRATWLQGPTHDIAMALGWVPFAVAAHAMADDPERLRWLVSATLLFSFAHQPLTLWLVYADTDQRRAHLRLCAWAPAVAAIAVAAGSSLRPELVAIVAGLWNLTHTLRQRYGIARLYGRISGIDCASDNRLLWSWLTVAVIVALAGTDLGAIAHRVGVGRRSADAIDALAAGRAALTILLPLAVISAAALTVRSARDELRRNVHSTPRLVYLTSTAALLAVLAVEPVTGFVGYVGAHAAEYLLMVRWRIGRAARRATPGDGVGALARRIGTDGTIVLYAAAVTVLSAGLRATNDSIAGTIILTLGALHILYDGLIWRSPARTDSISAPVPLRGS